MNIEEFNNNINHILDEGKIENIPIPNADIIKYYLINLKEIINQHMGMI